MTDREKCLLCGVGLSLTYNSSEHDPTAQAHQECLVSLLHGTLKQKLELLHQNRINKTRLFYNKQEILTESFELKIAARELPMIHVKIPILDMNVVKDGEFTNIIIVDEYTSEET